MAVMIPLCATILPFSVILRRRIKPEGVRSEESTSRTLDEDEAVSDESDRVVRRLVRHVRFFSKCEESDESTSRRLDEDRASSDESDRAGATRPTFVIKSYESSRTLSERLLDSCV